MNKKLIFFVKLYVFVKYFNRKIERSLPVTQIRMHTKKVIPQSIVLTTL